MKPRIPVFALVAACTFFGTPFSASSGGSAEATPMSRVFLHQDTYWQAEILARQPEPQMCSQRKVNLGSTSIFEIYRLIRPTYIDV